MSKCTRCKSYYAYPTRLANVYSANLCADCTNDWHEYIHDTEEFIFYVKIRDRKDICISRGDQISVDIYNDYRKIEKRLFEMAKDWCSKKIVRDKPEGE